MGAISDLRYKRNVSDSQVKRLDPAELYECGSENIRNQWKYTGYHMKPISRDIKYIPPENPDCKICLDKGTVWKKVNDRGRSRLHSCECKTIS